MRWRNFKDDTEGKKGKKPQKPPNLETSIPFIPFIPSREFKNDQQLLQHNAVQVEKIPQWQHDFCFAHAEFNNWRGSCPCSIDNCLISKILDCSGNIDNLRKHKIGQDITTDMVIDEWLESGEPEGAIFKTPAWLICVAESIKRNNI